MRTSYPDGSSVTRDRPPADARPPAFSTVAVGTRVTSCTACGCGDSGGSGGRSLFPRDEFVGAVAPWIVRRLAAGTDRDHGTFDFVLMPVGDDEACASTSSPVAVGVRESLEPTVIVTTPACCPSVPASCSLLAPIAATCRVRSALPARDTPLLRRRCRRANLRPQQRSEHRWLATRVVRERRRLRRARRSMPPRSRRSPSV